jgi:hypothetical protein
MILTKNPASWSFPKHQPLYSERKQSTFIILQQFPIAHNKAQVRHNGAVLIAERAFALLCTNNVLRVLAYP